ncbi:DNA translocase FtsK [Acidiferrobacter thiooxydans]|jgi:S-DNA-T family DNA segregation ATPase FtsK/SpoIIIE|uniref:DNA translocase FtsK n=1 Tax=Acidiferrobacter thiooxydans TaxID=163359 RepID=A0A1C2G0E5_9GAMM|nr:DNA translocase FtsK [Acidiferrobacter thiooxydans]RCN59005.1 DNA translocase FtsK [Acidiferrobacter thiooxydans]UEO00752.1 DNA translocase FtsK 4TM domain-containing protein [Acidiferrobacter thiooxydans]
MGQARFRRERAALAPAASRLVREALLFVILAAALYLAVTLATFHPGDPSWSHSGNGTVRNAGGLAGAWLSDGLLAVLGVPAYVIPILIAWGGVRLLRPRVAAPGHSPKVTALGVALAFVGACGLASLDFRGPASLPFRAGGLLGGLASSALSRIIDPLGATLFLLAVFLAGFTLATGLSWLGVMDYLGDMAFGAVSGVAARLGTLADRWRGRQARQEREETVQKGRKALRRPAPPRIEPAVEPIEGVRAARGRQTSFLEPADPGLPALSLLDLPSGEKASFSEESLHAMSRLLEKKLLDFHIEVKVEAVHPGPVITRFEIEPAPGIKASQITGLQRDLARALSVVSVRVVENIPGKTYIGIEVPNERREVVRLREILSSRPYEAIASPLALALGKDISGQPIVTDLARMPHLLIAGTTGSGKSVCLNALILSFVYKATPADVRLIMIDPKMLELAVYDGLPHLLAPVVTDMKQAAQALRWCIGEMDRRYRAMAALGVRNLAGYNKRYDEAHARGEILNDPQAPEGEVREMGRLPYVVIVIDELADLMMVVGKKVEELIARLAQKARAAGLHLVLATQRPSVDVITGLIKANIPARIAFQVSAKVDSRTVLDQMGAEQLLGHGDMLFLQAGTGFPQRIHGAFVADAEVHAVVSALKKTGAPVYDERIFATDETGEGTVEGGSEDGEADDLYDEALRIVTETRRASVSGVQRRLRIGYNRAARLIEQMERSGVVGPLQSNGSREVLAPPPPEVG